MSQKKRILSEDTIIVWGKISVGDYRKFFKQMTGKEISTGDMDFQTWLFSQTGKTLVEALDEYLHPSEPKNMQEMLSERRFNIISEPDKAFIIAFDEEISKLGYDFGKIIGSGTMYSSFMIIYGKTDTKSRPVAARIYIREDGIVLRLFFNQVDAHRLYIESAPTHIKDVFTNSYKDCKACKKGTPKYESGRCYKEYTIDGHLKRKCEPFWFFEPTMEKLPDYIGLLTEFYPIKKSKLTK